MPRSLSLVISLEGMMVNEYRPEVDEKHSHIGIADLHARLF